MTEDNLWEWLRDVALPLGQYSRVETGDTAPGFPDVHCQLGQGISPTLELKCARDPNRKIPFTEKRGMRRSQLRWIRDNLKNGGIVYVIAEVSPEIYLIPGGYADSINGATKKFLKGISRAVIYRSDPKEAARVLHYHLITEVKYA